MVKKFTGNNYFVLFQEIIPKLQKWGWSPISEGEDIRSMDALLRNVHRKHKLVFLIPN